MSSKAMSRKDCTLPKRVVVKEVISSRYTSDVRPENWSERFPGIDVVLTVDGEEIALWSDGQQGTPETGWTLLLTGVQDSDEKDDREGVAGPVFTWTLYGLVRGSVGKAQVSNHS